MTQHPQSIETATLAGGCFWCTEAIFLRLKGVQSVTPGYAGGSVEHPTYAQVCDGNTGHAEAVQIVFDPAVLPFETLLDVFFHLHDPTTKNQQGNDVGPQYRSVVFTHSDAQKSAAERVIKKLTDEHAYPAPIVTEVVPYTNFYEAEDYHKNYYAKNSYQSYCQYVIDPKITKLLKDYKDILTDEAKKT